MIERFKQNHRMSMAVRGGGLVHIAGQVAEDRKAGIEDQTRSVLGLIENLLKEAGTDKSKLLAVNVYLTNIADFETMNKVYDSWIVKDCAPARACVETRLADPDLRVEMTAVALA